MSVAGAHERIHDAVLSWPGVTVQPHQFGGSEFRLGRRELGHVHGDSMVDIPFPKRIRDEIVAAGRAKPHHILPDSGWISFYLESPDDVGKAIALMRESYDLAMQKKLQRSETIQH